MSDERDEPASGREFASRLGDHLRRIRLQKGLSLHDVEAASGKEFKASILGAYERGERAITAGRLWRLAELYAVPLSALLPADAQPAIGTLFAGGGVSLVLARLRGHDAPEARALWNYTRTLQALRGEWGADVVTVRGSDLYAIAGALDRSPDEMLRRIDELGLRPPGTANVSSS